MADKNSSLDWFKSNFLSLFYAILIAIIIRTFLIKTKRLYLLRKESDKENDIEKVISEFFSESRSLRIPSPMPKPWSTDSDNLKMKSYDMNVKKKNIVSELLLI